MSIRSRHRLTTLTVIAALTAGGGSATAFDLEDYASTFRQARDELFQAARGLAAAQGQYTWVRQEAIRVGIDPNDALFFPPPRPMLRGSCEVGDRGRFGANVSGPAVAEAMAAWVVLGDDISTADPLSGELLRGLIEPYDDQRDDSALFSCRSSWDCPPERDQLPQPVFAGMDQCLGSVDTADMMKTLRSHRIAYLTAVVTYRDSVAKFRGARAMYSAASETYTYLVSCREDAPDAAVAP